jgi:vancomycin permeability regulator SanA
VSLVALFTAYLSTIIILLPKEVYILGQPGNKIISAALFTVYQLLLFTFILVVWLKILRSDRMVVLRSLINSVFMILFFLTLTYIFIQTKGYGSDSMVLTKSNNNLAVVLGAAVWSNNRPSPSLSGRVDRAIELFNNEFAGKILLTGSNAPGEKSEAEVAFEYAKSNGMQMTKVRYESSTSSTSEQIGYIKKNLIDNSNIEEIIVVSDAYHLTRVLEIGNFFNIHIKVAASKQHLEYQNKFYRQLRESIALAVFWCFAL